MLRFSNRLSVLPSNKEIRLFSDRTPMQSSVYRTLKQEIADRVRNGENNLVIRHYNRYPKIVKRSVCTQSLN